MRIRLLIARQSAFRWQALLASRLRAAGHAVAWTVREGGEALPTGVAVLLQLEAVLYGLAGPRPSERFDPAAERFADDFAGEAADLTIDLGGFGFRQGAASSVLEPAYDGDLRLASLLASLLERRAPVLSVRSEIVLVAGLPALEQPEILTLGLDHVFSRLVDLLVRAVGEVAGGRASVARAPPVEANATARTSMPPARFAAASLARKLAGRFERLLGQDSRWRLGWRSLKGPSVLDTQAWPGEPYTWLTDDGARFFADPFVVEHEGGIVVLCEEFPFATGKGVISAFTIAPDGSASAPRVVLERPYHLSYPFVFRHAGALWMIPETSAKRTIELYRAERFPDRWALERVLIADVAASDATLVRHGGRSWLFATATEAHGSSWDALHLFHADHLFGEWRAHPRNPVLIDAGAARPAGAMTEGSLLRPAQDCRAGYGAGLTFCAVDRLDEGHYEQRVVNRLAPPPAWGASGVHTLNIAAGIEAIDSFGPRTP